jgi:predicted transcriptional regulator
MKIPCEVIVWYVLPSIRRELAIELIQNHGVSQKKAAQLLDVTTAAVCQYVNEKRGQSIYNLISDKKTESKVREQLKQAAKDIQEKPEMVVGAICQLCNLLKREGVIGNYYREYEKGPIPQNILCFDS